MSESTLTKLTDNKLLTTGEAARSLPRAVRSGTILRWVAQGLNVNGIAVKLKAVRQAGRWLVLQSDLTAFLQATGGGSDGE